MSEQDKISSNQVESVQEQWREDYRQQIGTRADTVTNISGIAVQPLYTPADSLDQEQFLEQQGFPGQFPYTRGIYPTMHRGRT